MRIQAIVPYSPLNVSANRNGAPFLLTAKFFKVLRRSSKNNLRAKTRNNTHPVFDLFLSSFSLHTCPKKEEELPFSFWLRNRAREIFPWAAAATQTYHTRGGGGSLNSRKRRMRYSTHSPFPPFLHAQRNNPAASLKSPKGEVGGGESIPKTFLFRVGSRNWDGSRSQKINRSHTHTHTHSQKKYTRECCNITHKVSHTKKKWV